MEIVINPLDPESVQAAIAAIEAYKENLEKNQERLVYAAVNDGAIVANQVYLQHPGDHGTATATPIASGKEGILLATAPSGENGSEIGFIEFGTGVHHPEWDSSQVPYTPPEHGSFPGLGQGKDPGWWYYGGNLGNKDRGWESKRGNITDGRDPASAMLWARQTMIESVLDNAREVFRS